MKNIYRREVCIQNMDSVHLRQVRVYREHLKLRGAEYLRQANKANFRHLGSVFRGLPAYRQHWVDCIWNNLHDLVWHVVPQGYDATYPTTRWEGNQLQPPKASDYEFCSQQQTSVLYSRLFATFCLYLSSAMAKMACWLCLAVLLFCPQRRHFWQASISEMSKPMNASCPAQLASSAGFCVRLPTWGLRRVPRSACRVARKQRERKPLYRPKKETRRQCGSMWVKSVTDLCDHWGSSKQLKEPDFGFWQSEASTGTLTLIRTRAYTHAHTHAYTHTRTHPHPRAHIHPHLCSFLIYAPSTSLQKALSFSYKMHLGWFWL